MNAEILLIVAGAIATFIFFLIGLYAWAWSASDRHQNNPRAQLRREAERRWALEMGTGATEVPSIPVEVVMGVPAPAARRASADNANAGASDSASPLTSARDVRAGDGSALRTDCAQESVALGCPVGSALAKQQGVVGSDYIVVATITTVLS
jgi:hypothetical protein